MVVVIAMRIISFFYIANSNFYVMSPIIPMGKKPKEARKKTLPYGGNSFINNVLSHFKTCACFVLYNIAHLCIEFDCVSNKYRNSLSNLCKNSEFVKPCLVNASIFSKLGWQVNY